MTFRLISRDVDFNTLWNVVTLVSTLRRWKMSSLERRDVASNIATLRCLRPKSPSFVGLTLLQFCLNPNPPAHQATPTLAGVPYHTGRRPVFCPPTPYLKAASPSHTPSHCPGLTFTALHIGVPPSVKSSSLGLVYVLFRVVGCIPRPWAGVCCSVGSFGLRVYSAL